MITVNYKGKTVQIDQHNLGLLQSKSWSWINSNVKGLKPKWYLLGRRNNRTVYFHREIIQARKGEISDHIDGDTLNLTEDNLRAVTPSENRLNAATKTGKTLPKGVFQKKNSKRFYSKIARAGRETLYRGGFTDVNAASEWYNSNQH